MSTPSVIERFSFGLAHCKIICHIFEEETENNYIYPNGVREAKRGYLTFYKTYAEARRALIAKATEDLEAGRAFVVRQTAILERANAIPIPVERPDETPTKLALP